MDFANLPPAPWQAVTDAMGAGVKCPAGLLAYDLPRDVAEFIALARNAFAAMAEFGLYSVPRLADGSEWWVLNAFAVPLEREGNSGTYFVSADPFTCLAIAGAYMRAGQAQSVCPRCEGSGRYSRLGEQPKPCAVCDGTGRV